MIEVIYKEEKKEAQGNEEFFCLPKNIRQIGESGGSRKIYVEDYVYTFLKRAAAAKRESGKAALLLGRLHWQEGVSYTFIRGALLAEEMDAAPEKLAFTEEVWMKLEEKEKEFFPELEVVGWFFSAADLKMEITDSLRRAHLDYFGGGEKVLLLLEPLEKEEAFFLYENGDLRRQPGYYIYYEKNPQMQEYMLSMKETLGISGEEEGDRAVSSFRKMLGTKKEEPQAQEPSRGSSIFYGAAAAAAAAALAIGIHALNGYEKLGNAAQEIWQTTSLAVSQTERADGDKTAAAETARRTDRTVQAPKRTSADEGKETPSAAPSAAPLESKTPSAAPKPAEASETAKRPEAKETPGSETPVPAKNLPEAKETPGSETPASAKDLPEAEKKEEPSAPARETAGNSLSSSYTVQLGDSLYKISTEKYGDMGMIRKICELNGISVNDIIYPGQIILLP